MQLRKVVQGTGLAEEEVMTSPGPRGQGGRAYGDIEHLVSLAAIKSLALLKHEFQVKVWQEDRLKREEATVHQGPHVPC